MLSRADSRASCYAEPYREPSQLLMPPVSAWACQSCVLSASDCRMAPEDPKLRQV